MLITLHLWPSIAMRSADRTHIHKLGEGIIVVLPGMSAIVGQIFLQGDMKKQGQDFLFEESSDQCVALFFILS